MMTELSPHPILDAINEGVFTVDLDRRITGFNRAAERITGVRRAYRPLGSAARTSRCWWTISSPD